MQRKWTTRDNKYKVTQEDWGEIGQLQNNSSVGNWVFGSFREIESLANTQDFELKYWEFQKSSQAHEPKFQVLATEYNFIIEGRIRGRVGDKKGIELKTGDYIIIKPGEIVNLQQEVLENTKGVTIKVPSRHGDTIKKSFIETLLNFEK